MDYAAIVDQVLQGLFYVFCGVVVIGFLGYFLWYKNFNKKVRVRIMTGTKKIIKDYWASEVMRDGVRYWLLLWKWDLLPVPPPNAIDVDNKGRMVVETHYTETGEYRYARDTYGTPTQKQKDTDDFEPFTTNQRLSLINQIKKAYSKKKMSWTEHIPALAGMLFIVIMLVVFFMYWEDIVKPGKEVVSTAAAITDKQLQIVQLQQEILLKKQSILNDPTIMEVPLIDANAPPQ